MSNAFSIIDAGLTRDQRTVKAPLRKSFLEFLELDAKAPIGGGEHGPYSFSGREVILIIVRHIDSVLGIDGNAPIEDSITNIAGGAQWGKTVLELNLAAYATSQRWLATGLFLPDDKLVDGVVDTKLRPDVIDCIPWFAEMTQVGKAVNKSGKAVNRKGAFTVTDGARKATGMVLGLQKVPTTFTLDIAAKDELDDIPPKNEKFVKGRLTASKLRYTLNIGTQRVHGRGQHAKWKNSSQGVIMLGPVSPNTTALGGTEATVPPAEFVNPEEAFPGVVRLQLGEEPNAADPKLTWTADFRRDGSDEIVATHAPGQRYYLAHPDTGMPLDRACPMLVHRKPARLQMNDWSIRVSQLSIGAIGLSQIVGQFTLAVADPDEMTVFRCDVLALPQSLSQSLTPGVIDRSRTVAPYEMRIVREPSRAAFAGLDMGDRCYLYVREIQDPACKRLIYATTVPAADVVTRMVALGNQNLWDALFIDQRPLIQESRGIALALNGLASLTYWPAVPKRSDEYVSAGHIQWNGSKQRWRNLKCAVVRFDKKKPGMGIDHGFDVFSESGMDKWVPLINCNRDESVDRVVREFLTPDEGVQEVILGHGLRVTPAMLLPVGNTPVLTQVEEHLIAGSERERNEKTGEMGSYVDGIANHFLFADAYSSLAEQQCSAGRVQQFAYERIQSGRSEGGILL